MDPSSIIDVIVPYLERSGMGILVTVCLSVILIATTIWIIAWVLDHRSIKNLIKNLSCLIDFSKKRFRKANASPYDSLITNSKIFNIIEIVYLYVVFGTMALYGTGTIVIGITGKAIVWWGNAAVIGFGILILIVARFAKVEADKAYYRLKYGKDWDDET